MKIDFIKKLTSRKLWAMVAGLIIGVWMLATAGASEELITGCVMSLGSIVAYIVGEGMTDVAAIKQNSEN